MSEITNGPDGKPRCKWCAAAPEFFDYHDREWGFPVDDDQRFGRQRADFGCIRGSCEGTISLLFLRRCDVDYLTNEPMINNATITRIAAPSTARKISTGE